MATCPMSEISTSRDSALGCSSGRVVLLQWLTRSKEESLLAEEALEQVTSALRAAVLEAQHQLDHTSAVKTGTHWGKEWRDQVNSSMTVPQLLELMVTQHREVMHRLHAQQQRHVSVSKACAEAQCTLLHHHLVPELSFVRAAVYARISCFSWQSK